MLVLGGLIGAIVWNLLTWLLGLPSSFQSCTADDMARVSAQLARGGWPLSADLQD
jgi:phosphate/sulfate permease